MRVIFQTLSLLLTINSTLTGFGRQDAPDGGPEACVQTESPIKYAEPKGSFIDPTLVPPQEEFFLDMFIERYPAEGGYRVKRFDGYDYFEADLEHGLEKKRQRLEASWTKQFRSLEMPVTPLPDIEIPFRDAHYTVTGFNSRPTRGFARHKAYDIVVPEGTPVHPIGNGIVIATESNWWKKVNHGEPIRIADRSWWDSIELKEKPISLKSGNFVVIYHPPASPSKKPGYYSFYAHMADGLPVAPGQIVGPSDIIGYVEHSGYNAMRAGHGGHLHTSILMNLGNGYLEPIRFAKYWGIVEKPPRRWAKTMPRHRKPHSRPKKTSRHA